MPWAAAIPLISAGISGIAGLFGNKGSARTSTQTITNKPDLLPGQQDFIDNLTGKYSSLLAQNSDMHGYEAQGIANINQNASLGDKAAQNYAAARGITGPAALTPQIMNDNTRVGQISQFSNSIPLLARQQMMQNLTAAGQFASSVPHGTTQTQTGVAAGSPTAGVLGNVGNVLSYFAGKGALFGGGGGGGTSWGNDGAVADGSVD